MNKLAPELKVVSNTLSKIDTPAFTFTIKLVLATPEFCDHGNPIGVYRKKIKTFPGMFGMAMKREARLCLGNQLIGP
jgi:hypothetical protein